MSEVTLIIGKKWHNLWLFHLKTEILRTQRLKKNPQQKRLLTKGSQVRMQTNEEYKKHCIASSIIFHYHASALALSEDLIVWIGFQFRL